MVVGVLRSDLEQRRIAVGERPHELVVEIVGVLAYVARHALLVHHARVRDFTAEPRDEVAIAAPIDDVRFVVELDLADEQLRVALGRCMLFGAGSLVR